jgi:hypothetical protein
VGPQNGIPTWICEEEKAFTKLEDRLGRTGMSMGETIVSFTEFETCWKLSWGKSGSGRVTVTAPKDESVLDRTK